MNRNSNLRGIKYETILGFFQDLQNLCPKDHLQSATSFFMEKKPIHLQRKNLKENFSLPAYPPMLALFLLIYLRSKKKV